MRHERFPAIHALHCRCASCAAPSRPAWRRSAPPLSADLRAIGAGLVAGVIGGLLIAICKFGPAIVAALSN